MTKPPALARRGVVGWILATILAGSASAQSPGRLTVRGNGTELSETPAIVELKRGLAAGDYVLRRAGQDRDLPAQVFDDQGKAFLAVVLDRVPAQGEQTYELRPRSSSDSTATAVSIGAQGANLAVRVANQLFTEYLIDAGPKPYYFPVIGPTGAPYTRAYPMKQVAGEDKDHPHQRSLWFTHGKVNGVDFWSEQGRHGSIKETSRRAVVEGPAVGLIRTTDDWLGPDGHKVCEDERVVRVYNTRTTRILDFDITVKATAGPVTFGDTKEGMFGLRVASSMDVKRKQGGKITNAEGVTDLDAWGKASPWVDYTGPVEGKTVGIAILNHPESFRYPTTWHVRDYGLFAANPFGWHDFGRPKAGDYTVPSGESIAFRYRVIFHEGETSRASIPAFFQGYAKPPEIDLSR